MKGVIINVQTNINQTQLMVPHLAYDEAIIGVFLKQWVEFKYFFKYIFKISNLVIVSLKDEILTPLCTILNVIMHPKWTSLFVMHTTLSTQIDGEYI